MIASYILSYKLLNLGNRLYNLMSTETLIVNSSWPFHEVFMRTSFLHWMHGHHNHLSNLLDVERRVLLCFDNCYFLHNIHSMHNLSLLAVVQHHIVATWPVS